MSSLIATDSTSESGTERNYVIQFIAEDKRQVLKIVQSIEVSFCKSAVKSLKQAHENEVGSKTMASQEVSCLKQGRSLANEGQGIPREVINPIRDRQ